MNEDDIIAAGLAKVREGLKTANWSLVTEGYADISGETIEVAQKPKSRLEAIREKLASAATPTETTEKAPDYSELTVPQITEKLLKNGFEKLDLKGKKKQQLIEMLSDGKPVKTALSTDDTKVEKLDKDMFITTQKLSGGKRFAREGFEVIQAAYNPTEAKANQQAANKTQKIRRDPIPSIEEQFKDKDEKSEWRFNSSNRRPPQAGE